MGRVVLLCGGVRAVFGRRQPACCSSNDCLFTALSHSSGFPAVLVDFDASPLCQAFYTPTLSEVPAHRFVLLPHPHPHQFQRPSLPPSTTPTSLFPSPLNIFVFVPAKYSEFIPKMLCPSDFSAQELCESRGGRPGLPVPNSP